MCAVGIKQAHADRQQQNASTGLDLRNEQNAGKRELLRGEREKQKGNSGRKGRCGMCGLYRAISISRGELQSIKTVAKQLNTTRKKTPKKKTHTDHFHVCERVLHRPAL